MHREFNGRVVLVTRASSGIGEATALAFSAEGARVAAGARRADRLESLARKAPGEILPLNLDVTDQESATAFSEALRQEVTAQGVRVVVVEPDFVATELINHNTEPTMRALARDTAAAMRTLQPEDIANAVVYAVTQPEHVAVNEILVRPTDQTR
ncbi:SDR family NAD(P)-dependent oxidoreductase [Actinomadura verrucosospora]|uniref:SDR family NAD(P)-dependent oxidoreductase n=1 Tax=Actinomadura verrucosospora TaxID=46165 RepID=UPI0031E60003